MVGTGQVADATYFNEWARLRARNEAPGRAEIQGLTALARGPREHILIAALEIDGGRRLGDTALFAAGLERFRAGLHDEQLEVLSSFPDLAILGAPERRPGLLRDVWVGCLGADHPVLRLLSTRDEAVAEGLLGGDVRDALESLPPGLCQELKRQIGWWALDAYVARRSPVWPRFIKSEVLALRPEEAGYWEYDLIRTLTLLAQGLIDDGLGRLRNLTRTHARGGWRELAVRRACTTYSYLASPRAQEWLDAMPGAPLTMSDASTPAEELGAFFALAATGSWSDSSLETAFRHLPSRPSAAFLFLLQLSHQAWGTRLARLVRESAQDETTFKGLPWPGRHEGFAAACEALPPDFGLPLLAAAAEIVGTQSLIAQLVQALEGASAPALDLVSASALMPLLQQYRSRLSTGTAQMLDRRLVYRAVIDGSSLVLVGAHQRERNGQLRYYTEAVAELRQAGFREIVTYFDASLRHGLPADDWYEIERLENARQAMIVRGSADRMVIASFLESPDRTWIVTRDDYRDHLADYPRLLPYWFKHRLHFHVDQRDLVVWDRPLDSPELPSGSPKTPSRSN